VLESICECIYSRHVHFRIRLLLLLCLLYILIVHVFCTSPLSYYSRCMGRKLGMLRVMCRMSYSYLMCNLWVYALFMQSDARAYANVKAAELFRVCVVFIVV